MVLKYSTQQGSGFEAPNFQLKGTDDKVYSLADFSDKKGLLVVFTCNHCPYAQAAWPLTIELYQKFKNQVSFVAINSNDAEKYPKDSFAEMKKLVRERQIPFLYLRDESQEVALAYDAQCTPDLYLFRREGNDFKLYYRGCINDNWQEPEKVSKRNLEEALESLVAGRQTPENQPPSMGCSIKWKQ